MEKWNELCYILSENIPSNASEQLFELKVIQAFEKLGWSEYNNEIVVRDKIHIGAKNRISPDLVFKSKKYGNLFIVEVKKPTLEINNLDFENQLSSYMGVLRLELGVLIGSKIQIYVDGKLFNKNGIILIEEIDFIRNNDKGLKFIELFRNDSYDFQNIKEYAKTKIQQLKEIEDVEALKKDLLSNKHFDKINNAFKSELLKEYSEQLIDKVFCEIEIKFVDKNNSFLRKKIHTKEPLQYGSFVKGFTNNTINGQLPIGKYVLETFNELIVGNYISRKEIENLQDANYSKQTFDIQFAFLRKEFPPNSKERTRYWKNPVNINGSQYFVCSQWYETAANNDRPYYENWLKQLKKT